MADSAPMNTLPPLDPAGPHLPGFRLAVRFAMSRFGRWFGIHVASRLDPILMRISGGRLSTFLVARLVIVSVPGRKSQIVRTTPLLYFTQGDEVIIIASSFGRERHPAWYRNVMAHPEVELRAGGRGGPYVARETEGEERERLYRLAAQLYPGYDEYAIRAAGANRTIAVLALRPAAQGRHRDG